MDKKALGNFGEDQAAQYLRRKGYKILARNFRCRMGEIDIIACKGNFVAFVEVKMRKNDSFAAAREFVTVTKQRRIVSTASIWLASNLSELQPRFDVIEVYSSDMGKAGKIQINHIEDAFIP